MRGFLMNYCNSLAIFLNNVCVNIFSHCFSDDSSSDSSHSSLRENKFGRFRRKTDIICYQISQTKLKDVLSKRASRNSGDSVLVLDNINSEKEIKAVVDGLLSRNVISATSSLVVVVPVA